MEDDLRDEDDDLNDPINTMFDFVILGSALLVTSSILYLGPIDSLIYTAHQFTGKGPRLQTQLTEYVRGGIRRENPNLNDGEVEAILRRELDYKANLEGEIDPMQVSPIKLFDLNEKYAETWHEQFLWPSLNSRT